MKKGPHKMMLESSRYDKWGGGGGGGAPGGGGGTSGGSWAGRERERERERDRERERQARAHQMSSALAPEPDASTLFPAPFRVTDNKDRVSQQIQNKLGDYLLAQTLLDDPSKSIGICAEPASPAPCHPSRRESEFKRPAHAPQNGRVHHRPYYSNKNELSGSAPSQSHRPPPIRIPNGFQHPSSSDSSSQPPIESILKEMRSLPTPLSVIAATPRKELDNKFIFNPYTNKVQENPQLTCNDLKAPLTKPGLDNRLSESRSPVSPELVQKDLGISSDDETAATTTRLHPILSPIGSGGSQSSGSESSASDSESESSSTESSSAAAPPAAPEPPERSSWSLSNFAFPAAQPQQPSYDSGKDVEHVLADVKGKPSPISELSDTEASSPSPDVGSRRRSKRTSCSDDEPTSAHNNSSPRVSTPSSSGGGGKRGRPPKPPPAKKKRGRPPKHRPSEEPPAPLPPPPQPPPQAVTPLSAIDTKTHIFRKVFTPKKGDEGGGKGGKGGKGKGGKGKGQVTIIEVTAPDDDDRRRDRSDERRKNEEAIAARLSPPKDFTSPRRHDRISDRTSDRHSSDRSDRSDRRSSDRLSDRPTITSPRLPPDRLPITSDRLSDKLRIPDRTERMVNERLQAERMANERLQAERLANERLQAERLASERLQAERISQAERLQTERISQAERLQSERLSQERLSNDRLQTIDRLQAERLTTDRPSDRSGDRLQVDRLTSKLSIERLERDRMERMSAERVSERYVKAEADVGSGLVKSERGSERLTDPCSNERRSRPTSNRIMVRIPLSRLRTDTVRTLQLAANKRTLLRHSANNTAQRVETACPAAMTPVTEVEVAGSELSVSGPRTLVAGEVGEAEEGGEGGPIYYSYFERLPPDALSDEERDHQYYLGEAGRLRAAAEREAGAVARVMLYLESVLCFVLTGRVLELELDTKQAFTIYRETIEYIRSIHAMPQRYRASPCSTFTKLDILSLRVQALLYLRMFKMYNREVKEYYKIVQEYQQKPASAESVSPLSPSPVGAGSGGSLGAGSGGSVGSLGSGGSGGSLGSGGSGGSLGSASSGYYSLAHAVPAAAHNALLQLTKYYTFLYVAHELWEQADCLCRLRPNQDLFIAVDRKCGPLTLFSTFRHLVQYVRYAISLLKNQPRE